ncbi:MAG: pyridoxal 5'-phosphate synthase glutaminase subunit PdxT [Anaerolineaceae bacterium]|nr:pyridoxal 5'-phosphate synthase glutaminase subunit PdxT [Anaerolineaceae bacterium]
MRIGVLALQGDFLEHQKILESLSVNSSQVRLPGDLKGLDGLIIPGGESTTIGKLVVDFNLLDPLRSFAMNHAVWGTCAGSILLSKDARRSQPLLEIMDIQVDRNAFGRQIDSFEIDLEIPALAKVSKINTPFHAIFIRAPLIESVAGKAKALAQLPNGKIVAAEQGKWLATSFHPELTSDDRFHRYFLEMTR